MNKTVTINISGIIFHIDEDAFDALSAYLSAIKAYVGSAEGGMEMMADIEARIAELLQERLGTSRQVVSMADVDHVRAVMGRPEDFGTETSEMHQEQPQTERVRRRLFRNPDEKILGGVCSGLSAYFDIETVWVRLAMFILVFFGGLSIWVYIILWIVIPPARTTAEKLAMRGESANLNNIMRNFKEEAQDVKNRLGRYGNDLNRAYGERVRSNISNALDTTFNIIGRLFGLFLIFLGTALLLGYVASITGISVMGSNHVFHDWRNTIFTSPADYTLAIIAFIVVLGIPIFSLLYVGIKLLFRIRYSNRWLSLSLGMIWLCGIILGLYVTIATVQEFTDSSRVRDNVIVSGISDTVVVKMKHAPVLLREWQFDNSAELEDEHENDSYMFGHTGNKRTVLGRAGLDVIESASDSVELSVSYSAQGSDKENAHENARSISYNYERAGNAIVFDELFRVEAGTNFRVQRVDIKLKLPVGKVIYFDESAKELLDDVDNTTNTWDGDMVGRRWKMTEKGLECIDCDNLESKRKRRSHKVSINEDGIKVDDEDTKIRIDKRGILIHTPDKDYRVESDSEKR